MKPRYIYVAMIGWPYEGYDVDGIYLTLKEARGHQFSGGDIQELRRYKFGTSKYTVINPPKRKKR